MTLKEAKEALEKARILDNKLDTLPDSEGMDILEKSKTLRKSVRDFGLEVKTFVVEDD